MIITTTLRKATRNVGTRVVAMSDENHYSVELYDWNKSASANHEAAAQLVSQDAQLVTVASIAGIYVWEVN